MRQRNLIPWPNRLGYTYKGWELVPNGDTWTAWKHSSNLGFTTHRGTGSTWADAIQNATASG